MIPNYLNPDAAALLASYPKDSDRDWIWFIIESLKRRYPEADHWTTGGKAFTYTDIRVGRRKLGQTAANVFFRILTSGGRPTCCLAKWLSNVLAADASVAKSVSPLSHPSSPEVEAWLDQCDAAMGHHRAKLKGNGLFPVAFGASIPPAADDEETSPKAVMETSASNRPPMNSILFGPPGTGKTYATIDETLAIVDPEFLASHDLSSPTTHAQRVTRRQALKNRFDELVAQDRVRFVTFHQSFSYEDFVEGLRAVEGDEDTEGDQSGLRYRVEPGVFKQLCTDALRDLQAEATFQVRKDARIWKISIDGTGDSATRAHCLSHGEARIGWAHVGDLLKADLDDKKHKLGSHDRNTLFNFANAVQPGDVVLCIKSATSVGAVGVVNGPYRWDDHPPAGIRSDYCNVLPVQWIASGLDLDLRELNAKKVFVQKTLYEIHRFGWAELLAEMQKVGVPFTHAKAAAPLREPHVLIIDEINRGSVSRIFGELITLIEPSKRAGAAEALTVTLPYSKQSFSVPDNVFLLGTMNTADRSLSGLDIALRRRFVFKEMPPRPDLLAGVTVAGVDISRMLREMNDRIEVLLDRDHLLGHAYFMRLVDAGPEALSLLSDIFRNQILPLLQEYFFEDWERVAWVLNDQRKLDEKDRFIVRPKTDAAALFGASTAEKLRDDRWRINDDAFGRIGSYAGILTPST